MDGSKKKTRRTRPKPTKNFADQSQRNARARGQLGMPLRHTGVRPLIWSRRHLRCGSRETLQSKTRFLESPARKEGPRNVPSLPNKKMVQEREGGGQALPAPGAHLRYRPGTRRLPGDGLLSKKPWVNGFFGVGKNRVWWCLKEPKGKPQR